MDSGKSFQTFADATENGLSPRVFFVFLELSSNKIALLDLKLYF